MSTIVRLAVLGDPLAFTRSPELHRAGCAAAGLACESVALRTPLERLEATLRELAEGGYRGCNLTHPLKERALELSASASAQAKRARSVNTITFTPDGPRGETTDGGGFLDLLRERGRDPSKERVVLLGAGGAARSLALALKIAGCIRIVCSAPRPEAVRAAWGEEAPEVVGWRGPEETRALASATLVVNATPLGAGALPAPDSAMPKQALVVDLTYGPEPTAWVLAARAGGREAIDGLGLLIHQARRSLEVWLGCEIPIAPLAAAVGWPR